MRKVTISLEHVQNNNESKSLQTKERTFDHFHGLRLKIQLLPDYSKSAIQESR